MKGRLSITTCLLFVFLLVPSASGDAFTTFTVNIEIYGFTVESTGEIDYDCECWVGGYDMTGYHRIIDGAVGTVAETTFGPTSGGFAVRAYSATISAGTQYEHWYRAQLYAKGSLGAEQHKVTEAKQAPPPPPSPGDGGEEFPEADCGH
jgi:hypothetical protein